MSFCKSTLIGQRCILKLRLNLLTKFSDVSFSKKIKENMQNAEGAKRDSNFVRRS